MLFNKIDIITLEILKEEIKIFINCQKELIHHSYNHSERYNRIMFLGVGESLYENYEKKILMKATYEGVVCDFEISLAEAAFLQFTCCFQGNILDDFKKYQLIKFSNLIDEQIKSII